jgi:hypothetical protein
MWENVFTKYLSDKESFQERISTQKGARHVLV